ncbi:MAG: 2-hydroxyacyl-CoA dehydratase [Candidatus Cloacimonadia bacterium]
MKVGFTTSFPVEVVFAAGHTPIDLNNIFILNKPLKYVQAAEAAGFPRNTCAWIKGLYETILQNEINTVVGIVQGDCSNTHSLMSLLKDKKIDVISFSFPYEKTPAALQREINKLQDYFGVNDKQVLEVKKELDQIRKKLIELDRLTYTTRQVNGGENHLWLVSSSDFNSDPVKFSKELDLFLAEAKERKPYDNKINLAFIGVPPIITDIYDYFPTQDADVTFNEVQRQFSMPYLKNSLLEQYLAFTYPYSVYDRINDIKPALIERKIDGIISYSQAFCHRQIDNILLKKYLKIPFLAVEGDQPSNLDERTKVRLESFLDVIRFSRN